MRKIKKNCKKSNKSRNKNQIENGIENKRFLNWKIKITVTLFFIIPHFPPCTDIEFDPRSVTD